jgi:hypothetical protein
MLKKWVLGAVVIALALVCAAPAFAGDLSLPVNAQVANGGLSPLVKDVWVFDAANWMNGPVMTGSPAQGGGSGPVVGGGLGGGGCVDVLGVVDLNNLNVSAISALAWLDSKGDLAMELLTKDQALVWLDRALALQYIDQLTYNTLYNKVYNAQSWRIYLKRLCLSYHDPAGQYDAWVKAVAGGPYTELSEPFTYLDVVAMDADFNPAGVNFGLIQAGNKGQIAGDFDWGGDMPTVQNLGNVPLDLQFGFSKMLKPGGKLTDVIDKFDLEFQAATWTDAEKQSWPLMDAEVLYPLGPAFPVCNRAKLNFSVHPPNTIQSGQYTGTFLITFAEDE